MYPCSLKKSVWVSMVITSEAARSRRKKNLNSSIKRVCILILVNNGLGGMFTANNHDRQGTR